MKTTELIRWLDDTLRIHDIEDYRDAFNGLQVEGPEDCELVAFAVDACAATIEEAARRGAHLMIVHHGLFWSSKAPITGMLYRRLATLIRKDLGLYAAHLPLDAHPELGNNAVLLRALGIEPAGRFGMQGGALIGAWGETDLRRDDLLLQLGALLGSAPRCVSTGPERIRRLGVVTGGAGTWIDKAESAGLDTLISGEGPHYAYFDAEERGLNLILGGHYATETFGLKALAARMHAELGLECTFIDHPTEL